MIRGMKDYFEQRKYLKEVKSRIPEYMKELSINTGNLSALDILKLNSAISCFGVRAKRSTFRKALKTISGNNKEIEKRTGNVGFSTKYGKEFGLDMQTVAPTEKAFGARRGFTSLSPVELVEYNSKFYFAVYGTKITEVEMMPAPSWYNEEINGIKASSILQYENGNLMGAIPTIEKGGKPYQSCIYKEKGKPCNFCAIQIKEKNVGPKEFAKVVEMDFKENPKTTVTLTGGNTPTRSRGIEEYIPFVEAIRNTSNIPIEIEVSPPKSIKVPIPWGDENSRLIKKYPYVDDGGLIEDLKDAGITSFMSNIEVWNKRLRKEVCPAKGAIPLEDYMNAFEVAQGLDLPTYSVLIVGLEPPESTLKGVEYLAKNGVTAVPLPFKPIRGAEYQYKLPTNPKTFMEVSVKAIELMREYGVNSMSRESGACSLCGGCSMEVNYDRNYDILKKYF